MSPLIATFTGPSGAGKSSYCREVLKRQPDWRLITSLTTRAPREKDLPGEYQYVTAEGFRTRWAAGEFLWTAHVHAHHYGTQRISLEAAALTPRPSLMLIEPNCVPRLRDAVGARPELHLSLVHFYFRGPSEEELRRRFARRRARGDQVDETEIDRRITECRNWDEEARASGLPYVFLPGDITIAEAAEKVINTVQEIGAWS